MRAADLPAVSQTERPETRGPPRLAEDFVIYRSRKLDASFSTSLKANESVRREEFVDSRSLGVAGQPNVASSSLNANSPGDARREVRRALPPMKQAHRSGDIDAIGASMPSFVRAAAPRR